MSTIQKKWVEHWKKHPHNPKTAEYFDFEQVSAVYELDTDSIGQIQDLALVAIGCASGKRMDDVKRWKSQDLSFVGPTATSGRMHKFVQDSGKTFSTGGLSEDKRTTVIPCHCLELLRSTREKQEFARALRENPLCKCPLACPFQLVQNYQDLVPDPKGIERARQIAAMTENDGDRGKIPEPLAFMRAKSSGSTPRFLLGNLGA